MRLIFTGGGTAGHITPAIAVADYFMANDKNTKILFIGRENGAENNLITNKRYDIKYINVGGLPRKISKKAFLEIKNALKAKRVAKEIIKEFMPDAVIGTGGYVAWPVVRAAQELGIPTFIHESNITPGLATRLLSKRCNSVFVNRATTAKHLPKKASVLEVGIPCIKASDIKSRNDARKALGLHNEDIFILSFGGSGGSDTMNKAIIQLMEEASTEKKRIRHLHATGIRYFEVLKENHPKLAKGANGCKITPFISDMEKIMPAADIVISRAGALTLAELSLHGIPAILIPSPNVTGNHQYKNALEYKNVGAAILINENELTPDLIKKAVYDLISSRAKRKELSLRIKKLHINGSCERIYKCITSYVKK